MSYPTKTAAYSTTDTAPPPYEKHPGDQERGQGTYGQEEIQNYRNEVLESDQRVNRNRDDGRQKGKVHAKPYLAAYKAMRCMAIIELILGIIALSFGISCVVTDQTSIHPTTTISSNPQTTQEPQQRESPPSYCVEGSGIWVGILCLVTGIVGLGALPTPTGRKCLLITYMILSVVCAAACGLLLIFSSIWTGSSASYYRRTAAPFYLAILIFNVILIIVSIVHGILSIVSASLLCYNFNCCKDCKPSPRGHRINDTWMTDERLADEKNLNVHVLNTTH